MTSTSQPKQPATETKLAKQYHCHRLPAHHNLNNQQLKLPKLFGNSQNKTSTSQPKQPATETN